MGRKATHWLLIDIATEDGLTTPNVVKCDNEDDLQAAMSGAQTEFVVIRGGEEMKVKKRSGFDVVAMNGSKKERKPRTRTKPEDKGNGTGKKAPTVEGELGAKS